MDNAITILGFLFHLVIIIIITALVSNLTNLTYISTDTTQFDEVHMTKSSPQTPLLELFYSLKSKSACDSIFLIFHLIQYLIMPILVYHRPQRYRILTKKNPAS